MIKQPTVFVLGAGASVPYGFPTGSQLIDIIVPAGGNLPRQKILGHSENAVKKFYDHLGGSFTDSIDVFLEKNPEFQTLGKRFIVKVIQALERPERIKRRKQNSDDDGELWYDKLLNRMDDSKHLNQFSENSVTFVTFNYDRSLEQFLFDALCRRYGAASQEEVAEQLCKIPFLHIHGSLGLLPWQEDLLKWDLPEKPWTIPYGDNINEDTICGLAENIKIISDSDIENVVSVHLSRQKLEMAKRIYFLGFGYHKTNVERLLHKIRWMNGEPIISGTGFLMSDAEKEVAERRINGIKLSDRHVQIKTFLRNSRRFLLDS